MFFSKFAACLVLAAPLVSALSVSTPSGWTSGGQANLTWTAVNGDTQSFSIELVNTIFHNSFALSNNVQTGAMAISFQLPIVPASDGYTVEFVNVGNISQIYASSGSFAIGATVSSSTSKSSSDSASTGSTSSDSASVTALSTATTPTVKATSGSSTGTSSPSAGSFNNGAVVLGVTHANLAGYAIMVAAALAGARFVGF